jgi:hypothetical protein
MEKIKSCRDCANFEDRRDIDKVAICALHSGPHVCCEEFKPRDESKNPIVFIIDSVSNVPTSKTYTAFPYVLESTLLELPATDSKAD